MLGIIKTSRCLSRQINGVASKCQISPLVPHYTKDHSCIRQISTKTADTKETDPKNDAKQSMNTTQPFVRDNYDVFRETNAPMILDVEEERARAKSGVLEHIQPIVDAFEGLNLERGVRGVYEIGDLVELLKRESAQDIFVCHVSKKLHYVDYLCIVTARSPRHMTALAEFVRKLFKFKRSRKDVIPTIEGKGSNDWIAMDLGNIALHIFDEDARIKYDLETLWTVGVEYDSESNKPTDPLIDMYEKHTSYLADLQPAEQNTKDDQVK